MEDVQKFVNENITDFGDSPFEEIGKFIAPAGYVKPIKKAAKAIKNTSKAVATQSEGTKE